MSLLDELIYGIKDVYVDGVLQPRRTAIDLLGGVVRDNPARRRLEVDLGGSGGSGGSSGGGLDHTLLVCPVTGDDATGGRQSPFKTIQAALDAAEAGDTVLVSPGEYDLGSGGLVWPAVNDVTLMGMPGPGRHVSSMPWTNFVPVSVILRNDGTVPVITGVLAADAAAALVACAVVSRGSSTVPAVRMRGTAGTVFGLRDALVVAFSTSSGLSALALDTAGVEDVIIAHAYGVIGAVILGASSVVVVESDSAQLISVAAQPGGVTRSSAGPCSVYFHRSTGGLEALGDVEVDVDEWSTLNTLSLDAPSLTSAAVTVRGTVEEFTLVLASGSGHNIDLRGATVVGASVTVSAGASRARIDARGCRTRPTLGSRWELEGPIDCNLAESPRARVLGAGTACVNRDVTAEFWQPALPAGGEFDVAIDPPLIANAEYRVEVETNYEVATWVTDKTSSGFKVHYGAGAGGEINGAAYLLGRI